MLRNKLVVENTIIEISNNWIGVQTVLVNKQIVSKIFSFSGCEHQFNVVENGVSVSYLLTISTSSKKLLLETNQVLVDLKRNGEWIEKGVLLNIGIQESKISNKQKVKGIKHLKEYNISNAMNALQKAKEVDNDDPEIYLLLACCYSNQENVKEGLACIKKALEKNLPDKDLILKHDMLAFLRIQKEFTELMEKHPSA